MATSRDRAGWSRLPDGSVEPFGDGLLARGVPALTGT